MALDDIADLIERDADRLVAAWADAVRRDETIKSDEDLSRGGLINHVPILIEEICDLLRSGQSPSIANTQEARVHSYTRFRQGYRARDLVRETSLLRTMLHDHIRAASTNERADSQACFDALRTVNLYIDEELRYAVAIYTEALPI